MAEVVISYSREDRDRIALIARQLEAIGVDVWFDRKIPAGRSFNQVILEEIRKSKVVLVCWSPLAVASKWVNAEATEADENNIYLPIKIAECKVGLPFNRLQTEDMTHWHGDSQDTTWLKIVDRIAHMAGRESISAAARALASGLEEDRYAFAKRFPDDPTAQRIWIDAERRHRAHFAERLIAAKQLVADRFESERAALEAELVFVNSEFENWLGAERRGAATGACPNPLDLTESKSGKVTKELRDQVSSLSRSLLSEQEKVERLSGVQAEAERLRCEVDEARLASKKAKWPLQSIGGILLIGLAGVAAGFAADRRIFAANSGKGTADIVAMQSAVASSARELEEGKKKLSEAAGELRKKDFTINSLGNILKKVELESLIHLTGCSGDNIYYDRFNKISEDWQKPDYVSTGKDGLLIDVGKSDFARTIMLAFQKYRDVRRVCAQFEVPDYLLREDVYTTIGFLVGATGDSRWALVFSPNKKLLTLSKYDFQKKIWMPEISELVNIQTVGSQGKISYSSEFDGNKLRVYIDNQKVIDRNISFRLPDTATYGLYATSNHDGKIGVTAFGLFR